jgi:hypothetical protein
MQNGSTPPGDPWVQVARIDASEVADHFMAWWIATNQHADDIEMMGPRGFALVGYMTGFRACIEMITNQNMQEPMNQLMRLVSLIDVTRREAEGGDSDN